MSGWAFSISSNNRTADGDFLIASVKIPPSSYPTYPAGEPISFAIECFSPYSLISKRINFTPSSFDNVFAISVFPTPVGPTKSKLASGLFSSIKPALENLTEFTTWSIASSCPNTWNLILLSSVARFDKSSVFTVSIGTRQILVNISFIASLPTVCVFWLSLCSFRYAPASSIRSIALSGKYLSLICLSLIFTAYSKTPFAYLTPWNFSYFDFSPSKIAMVSSIPGSQISIFWNLLVRLLLFSKYFLYSSKVVAPINLIWPLER